MEKYHYFVHVLPLHDLKNTIARFTKLMDHKRIHPLKREWEVLADEDNILHLYVSYWKSFDELRR